MRIDDIIETISNWTVDPNLDQNEATMISKFHGYDREMRHYSSKEKKVIRDTGYIAKVTKAFGKSPVAFSLYFWQSSNPNYDLTSFLVMVDEEKLRSSLGDQAADRILAQTTPESVTIVFTSNLSDENKVSLASPWIIAHRIVHAMVGDSETDEAHRLIMLMKRFLHKILIVGYGLSWPDEDTQYGRAVAHDYIDIYGKLMGETLGTMKSARTRRITSVYEWWYETITQFIVTGKITFNDLPSHFDEGLDLSRDPNIRKTVLRAWGSFPVRLEKAITKLLNEGRGKVFVV